MILNANGMGILKGMGKGIRVLEQEEISNQIEGLSTEKLKIYKSYKILN